MGPRNLLILFFSTVAVSLVILIIFFSLFFKNVNLDFNTRLPESAPDIGSRFNQGSGMNPDSKADGLMRSTVNVPPEVSEPAPSNREEEPEEQPDSKLPPVTDDALLEREPGMMPLPDASEYKTPDSKTGERKSEDKAADKNAASTHKEKQPSRTAASQPAPARPEFQPAAENPKPVAMPLPLEDAPSEPSSSGPPVPGQ